LWCRFVTVVFATVVFPFVVTVVVAFSLPDFVTTVFVDPVLAFVCAATAGVAISASAVNDPMSLFMFFSQT
jgi:Flp pilus assembly protein TadB